MSHTAKQHRRGASFIGVLSSLRLTVAILLAAAVLCVIGTVLPQGPVTNHGHGLRYLVERYASPYDIFHSVWIVLAGVLLCVNILACTARRPAGTRRAVLLLLMHGSIVAIIAGFVMGASGIDAFMEISKGKTATSITLKNGSIMDLGFDVRCDDFTVDHYENGMPREFVTRLTFLKDDRPADRATLIVNHPAHFGGFDFYQASYRQSYAAAMTVSAPSSHEAVTVVEGEGMHLSQAGVYVRVVKIWGDLMNAGPAVKLRIEFPEGSRYMWVFRDIASIREQVPGLFNKAPELDPSGLKPYTFSLKGISSASITGIGVKKDPGAPLAAAGGAVFVLSVLLFYLARGRKPSSDISDATDRSES